ncbi:MAG: response regulator [Candidatus Zixiibacteriota bacterium]|nr:MAG: response regulator [candidate division Zixibacteria bacterium]
MKRNLSILAIDDERIVLESIRKHVRKEEFTLHTVRSVKEALSLMDETSIDIILTDLMMPEVDGLEFLKIMKERAPQIPVIMITGYATINTALEATNLGAFDYVAKPFTRSELTSVLQRASEFVHATEARDSSSPVDPPVLSGATDRDRQPTAIREYGWKRLEDDGTILLGAAGDFLSTAGRIQNVFLPTRGDELRQGSVYLRIFSTDLRSHIVLTPLSGLVVEVNEKYLSDPASLSGDSDSEWLIRLKPSKFEFEAGELGL